MGHLHHRLLSLTGIWGIPGSLVFLLGSPQVWWHQTSFSPPCFSQHYTTHAWRQEVLLPGLRGPKRNPIPHDTCYGLANGHRRLQKGLEPAVDDLWIICHCSSCLLPSALPSALPFSQTLPGKELLQTPYCDQGDMVLKIKPRFSLVVMVAVILVLTSRGNRVLTEA